MATRAGPRSLWPREHGAYAQLAAPLVAALAGHRPTLAAGLIAAAACLAFLANEPLLVVLGHRGVRRREQDGPRAARRLALLGGVAGVAGVTGLVLARPAVLVAAAIVAVPAVALIAAAWRKIEHTLLGELAAAIALSGAAAPVAVAEGVSVELALAIWLAWAAGYASTVVAIHRVIARHKEPARTVDHVIAVVLAALTAAAVATAVVALPVVAVSVPLAVIAAALAIRPPRATRLRAIGVALVVASAVSGVLAATVAWCTTC